MRRRQITAGIATVILSGLLNGWRADVACVAAEINGVVKMPEICSPAISPAVVILERADSQGAVGAPVPATGRAGTAEIVLVNQRGLQFVPRVQVVPLGQRVRFGNQDAEMHNVHVIAPGMTFNQSMAPGAFQDFTPTRAGVMRLTCDIHIHMRGFVLVSSTPWAQVCGRDGRFRLDGVPDGRYVLTAWHEMGDSQRVDVTVSAGKATELAPIILTANEARLGALTQGRSQLANGTARPWPDVLDRISVALASCRDAAGRPGELTNALRLADDAYWREFETSDMETAIRRYLDYKKAGELERQFRAIRAAVKDVSQKRQPPSVLADLCHRWLLDLVAVARELNAKGITDGSRIEWAAALPSSSSPSDVSAQPQLSGDESVADPKILMAALKQAFHRIKTEAEQNGSDSAASELTSVYMTEFEPVERYLLGRDPQSVRPLEIEFNTLRGDLTAGLEGEKLSTRLDALRSEVETVVGRTEAQPTGTFAPAFFASLITIVREGVEVILVLAMLIALVSKASTMTTGTNGSPAAIARTEVASTAKERALRAIGWGVAAAIVASIATALALNTLVASAQGAAREILEGLVMLAASAVLFYVSYWLVSHLEAKRWMDFLKQQARRGLELSGQGTLALTAFLAVYREGAETSLMYQALLGSEGRTRPGLLGLAAGLAAGLILLALIAVLIRASTVRLPIRTFFKFSGMFLFGLAIVFAGNGVFELQNAGILLTTNVSWLGHGIPWAGLYPNVQVISVQSLLLAGAVAAWLLVPRTPTSASAAGAV